MEAALVERPTVGSRNAELEASVNSKDTVFFDTEKEFKELVSEMIGSKESREAISGNAFQSVCEKKLTIRDYSAFAEFMLSFCR